MSSLAAQRGFSPKMKEVFGTTAPSYYVAKAGIDALTRYMAGVGGDKNIRVNCIRPGQIMTPGATRGTINDPDGGHHVFESMFDLTQIIPGPGYPNDVANLVLFLVSEDSRFITSEIINIDGGVAEVELQSLGVPAHRVLFAPEVALDPQLAHRKAFSEVSHPRHGAVWIVDSAIHLSRTPGYARVAAPPAGEHLFEVLTEILGRSADEAADLIATGIFR